MSLVPFRIQVMPQTVEIMRQIQQTCDYIAPLDLSCENLVLKNEFLLCQWEYGNSITQREKIRIIRDCPMRSGIGILSVFEELLIRLLADSEKDDVIHFITLGGNFDLVCGVYPVEIELREDAMVLNEIDYLAWRDYLEEFHRVLEDIEVFRKSKSG